jgi:hypothetical protein
MHQVPKDLSDQDRCDKKTARLASKPPDFTEATDA